MITDPVVSKTLFAGTAGRPSGRRPRASATRTIAEAQAICNEWTGTFTAVCGDWAELGPNGG